VYRITLDLTLIRTSGWIPLRLVGDPQQFTPTTNLSAGDTMS
jgi:hypothetical protein